MNVSTFAVVPVLVIAQAVPESPPVPEATALWQWLACAFFLLAGLEKILSFWKTHLAAKEPQPPMSDYLLHADWLVHERAAAKSRKENYLRMEKMESGLSALGASLEHMGKDLSRMDAKLDRLSERH